MKDWEQDDCDEYYDRGYVVRMTNSVTGEVRYQGRKSKIVIEKDVLRPEDTFTLRYAKSSLANLARIYKDHYFLSIDRLSEYYSSFEEYQKPRGLEREMLQSIEHAHVRLDELLKGNDFHNGDKMRINEIRGDLNRIKENILLMKKK